MLTGLAVQTTLAIHTQQPGEWLYGGRNGGFDARPLNPPREGTPRGRLMIIDSAILVWITMSLPIKRLWNYDRSGDQPEQWMIVGSRQDGAGWVGFLVFVIITLELLRFVLNRPRRFERFHDRIIAALALAVAYFSIRVWWRGFDYLGLPSEFGVLAGAGWGMPFMILATLAVLFSVGWSFRSTTAGGSIRAWVARELREARDELRGASSATTPPTGHRPPTDLPPPPSPPTRA